MSLLSKLSSLFKRNYYNEMTRAVNEWWNTIYESTNFYDSMKLTLTIHLCGSEQVIESKASEILGRKVDYAGTAGLAFKKGKSYHIFALATEIGFVTMIPNYFSLGHELGHVIDFYNESLSNRTINYSNPDNLGA